MHLELMKGMTIQHLQFEVQALDSMVFGTQPGSALRGALYQALSENFCSEPQIQVTPDHQERCPVCWLLAQEHQMDKRGQSIPRPLTVEPPLGHHTLIHPGQRLRFGMSLIGRAQDMMPFVLRAVQKVGQLGVGKGRGRFKLIHISEVNPVLDVSRTLLDGNIVRRTTLQVTPARVEEAANQLSNDRITIEFLSPMRLTAQQRLIKSPEPDVFMHRLLERCERLAQYYAETDSYSPAAWQSVKTAAVDSARALTVGYDDTTWLEASSGSRRQERYTPIGGFIGRVRWEGDLRPLLPWIVWGQSLHVGKNAVKGNGWYRIIF